VKLKKLRLLQILKVPSSLAAVWAKGMPGNDFFPKGNAVSAVLAAIAANKHPFENQPFPAVRAVAFAFIQL